MKRSLSFALALIVSHTLWAQTTGKAKTIYSFVAPPGPVYPMAGPIISSGGVIYGTTLGGGSGTADCGFFGCGAVYELTSPAAAGGAWTESTLHSFDAGSDGFAPETGMVSGPDGTLYGWVQGDYGHVYALQPPESLGGNWTYSVIYAFKGPPSDGGTPVGGLAISSSGALYGATNEGGTYNQGTVFELAPPQSPGGAWTLTLLYSFRGDGDGIYPSAGVVVGANGSIYGVTEEGGALGDGTVFGLQLQAGDWKEKVLLSLGSGGFSEPDALVLGHDGALYGKTYTGIFKVTPPKAGDSSWSGELIYSFTDTTAQPSITLAPNGAIYWTNQSGGTSTACGVSNGCGTLNELMPPSSPNGNWTPVVLHNFTGQHGDGYQPNGGLVVTKDGSVYGTTFYGGDYFFGTVFRYTP